MAPEKSENEKVLSEAVIPKNTGMAFTVKQGQRMRVIGEPTADFVIYNLNVTTQVGS